MISCRIFVLNRLGSFSDKFNKKWFLLEKRIRSICVKVMMVDNQIKTSDTLDYFLKWEQSLYSQLACEKVASDLGLAVFSGCFALINRLELP